MKIKRRVKNCRDPWNSVYITLEGNVQVCCMRPIIMGNIHQQDFRDIWDGPAYNEFRQKLASQDPPKQCRQCPIRNWIEI